MAQNLKVFPNNPTLELRFGTMFEFSRLFENSPWKSNKNLVSIKPKKKQGEYQLEGTQSPTTIF